jgi:DNA-binding NtrC family response regulator
LGKKQEEVLGKQWEQVFPFRGEDKGRLKAMYEHLPEQRTKASAHVETAGGQSYWMEIEIHDDPHDPQRKIFFFYDVSEVHDLRRLLDEKAQFHDLVGKSKPMQLVYQQIRDLAEVDSTVLIEGETGTGKELVARAVHFASRRKDKPFIPVNGAGLTESLLGSQLFGHKKGAFTGAISDHKGVFEASDGGTIFLDEIGDIPMNVQTSLLRVLQEREITRLGESEPRKIDLRVIVATQHDLSEEVEKGRFRADLLYRIRVARIQLPPLSERREDIPLLVGYFLGQSRAATGKSYVEDISSEAMDVLLDYHWPGNLRELRNATEFAVIRCKGPVIQAIDLPPEIADLSTPPSQADETKEDERQLMLDILKRAGGNRSLAARMLGIGRTTLYRRLAELGIKSEE